MKQLDLYTTPLEARGGVVPFVPHVAPQKEMIRLSKQAGRVLERLRAGPATNKELSAIALKYTSRISDIRQSGIKVDIIRKGDNGLRVYAIRGTHHIKGEKNEVSKWMRRNGEQ